MKTLQEMRLEISQGPPGDGSIIWLDEPGWLFGSEKQRNGETVYLTGVYRKGEGDPQRPTTIQVCDDQSLTWGSCSSGAMLYLA